MLKTLALIFLLILLHPIILVALLPIAEWIHDRGGWSGFTKDYAPLIAITVFLVSSSFVYLTITRRVRPGSPIWVGIDGTWVMTSVAAFVLAAWASSSEILVKLAEDRITALDANSARVPLRINAFLNFYCLSGERALTLDERTLPPTLTLGERTLLPTLTSDELATCGFAIAQESSIEQIAGQVRWREFGGPIPDYWAHGIITKSRTPLTVAWSEIEGEVRLFRDVVHAFNEQRPSYLEARRNAALRLVWVWVFPLVAGLRLNKAFADHRKARGS